PQKQQCVLTRRSGSTPVAQPVTGTRFSEGPKRFTSSRTSTGSLAILASQGPRPRTGRYSRNLFSPFVVLCHRQRLAPARRANILVVLPVWKLVMNME